MSDPELAFSQLLNSLPGAQGDIIREHINDLQSRLEACKETGQRVDDQLIEAQRRLGDCEKERDRYLNALLEIESWKESPVVNMAVIREVTSPALYPVVERHVPNSPNIEPDDFSCCPAHRAGAPSSAPCDFVEK